MSNSITEITNSNEEQSFIRDKDLAIIFFGSSECYHCQKIGGAIQDLMSTYPRVKFAHVEVTKVKVDNVEAVPMFVGYKNGLPVDVITGADPRALREMIETKLLR